MSDICLFGATGYTGTLTAEALGRRGASFSVAGRNAAKLEALATRTGADATHVAAVGDTDALVRALREGDSKVLITCVGPFMELGDTAAEAALEAGVHYVDSTGEGDFIDRLIARYDSRARSAGVVMAPSMGFDEVPADLALALATEGMDRVDAVLTYAFPSHASAGTLRTIVGGIASSDGRWIKDGEPVSIRSGSRRRWAPMPPPLGPKLSVPLPFAESRLAPLHIDLRSLELYGTTDRLQAALMRPGMPVAKAALGIPGARKALGALIARLPAGPDEATRGKDRWTILAEARSGTEWRNVALSGVDPYGLTAETLSAGALALAGDGRDLAGVVSPVQAVGKEMWQQELERWGASVDVYEAT